MRFSLLARGWAPRAGGVLVLLVLKMLSSAPSSAAHDARGCETGLSTAYTRHALPPNMHALCGSSAHDAWLTQIELGPDVDIVRYWDLRSIAADLDRVSVQLPLDANKLAGVLVEMERAAQPPRSWWRRLREWAAEWMGADIDLDSQWFKDLLTRFAPPAWLGELVLRISVVLTLVAALYVVLREIELGRGRRSSDRRAPRSEQMTVVTGAVSAYSWQDMIGAPLAERPAAMLRWLVAVLVAHNLLPPNPCLTNREQVAYLGSIRPNLSRDFSTVVAAIEPTVFGRQQLSPSDLNALAVRVKALGDIASNV